MKFPPFLHLLLLSFALVIIAPSLRAEEQNGNTECQSANQLGSAIQYCEHNIRAAYSAKACFEKSKTEWNQTSEDISILEKARNSQKGEVNSSEAKYQSALDRVSSLVKRMQARAEQMEIYPQIMVDDREILNGSPSLNCYQENIDRIQKYTTDLDQLIVRGLHLIRSFAELRYMTNHVGTKIASEGKGNTTLLRTPQAAHSASGIQIEGSDITKRSDQNTPKKK